MATCCHYIKKIINSRVSGPNTGRNSGGRRIKNVFLLYLFIIEVEHDLSKEPALSSDDELVAEERAIIANKFKIHKGFSFAQLSEKYINLRSSINDITQTNFSKYLDRVLLFKNNSEIV